MKSKELKAVIREAVGEVIREMAKPNTRTVNKELQALTTNKYFNSIPTREIQDILDRNQMGTNIETGEPVMDGIFTGREGRMSEPVGRNQRGDPNMYFTMTWYKRDETGHYEIVPYVW